jgi:gluconokinase
MIVPAVRVVVVMGVSGSGKTTVGALLASRLGWPYAEADLFHPAANVAKMAAGHPLTDEDRAPWLAAIARYIDQRLAAGETAVVSCSALKRAYRDELRRTGVVFVYLRGDRELLLARMRGRHGHFFKAALLDSQLADLQEPGPDEHAVTVDIVADPDREVTDIVAALADWKPPSTDTNGG